MVITVSNTEFNEAISLWLTKQGFSADRYDIELRIIAGRSDSGAGARAEINLEPKPVAALNDVAVKMSTPPLFNTEE